MSTSDKLTYLNGTKQALKESINNIGGDITSQTTFREYAQELDNIYDNLPKTTGEGSSLSLNTLKGKMNIQVKGDTQQDGTPTPSTPIDIEVVTGNQDVKVENVNLLDYTKFVKGRINSTTGQIEYASNTTNITTTENTISFTTSQAWNSGIASEFIPIQQGNYIYSIKSATLKANVYIDLYDKDQNFISRLGNKVINANEQTTWQVTISNTSAKYIRLHYEMGYADTVTLTETQLEKGTTATPYKPHKEQTQTISLGDIELCKIGNYQDKLYHAINGNPIYDSLTSEQKALLNYGSWYKKEYIDKFIINGSENYNFEVDTNSYNYPRYTIYNFDTDYSSQASSITSFSNLASYCVNPGGYTNYNESFIVRYISGQKTRVDLMSSSLGETTANGFKTWLGTHNLEVRYIKATSNDIQITNETLIEQLDNLEKLKSYNGVTNINCSGNLSAILGVSAIKGES